MNPLSLNIKFQYSSSSHFIYLIRVLFTIQVTVFQFVSYSDLARAKRTFQPLKASFSDPYLLFLHSSSTLYIWSLWLLIRRRDGIVSFPICLQMLHKLDHYHLQNLLWSLVWCQRQYFTGLGWGCLVPRFEVCESRNFPVFLHPAESAFICSITNTVGLDLQRPFLWRTNHNGNITNNGWVCSKQVL